MARRQAWTSGLNPPPQKCRYSPSSWNRADWSTIRRWIVRNCQTLIVSTDKFCKRCLQTASASGGWSPAPTGASPLDPTGDIPRLLGPYIPQWPQTKISSAATGRRCGMLFSGLYLLFSSLIAINGKEFEIVSRCFKLVKSNNKEEKWHNSCRKLWYRSEDRLYVGRLYRI